MADLVPTCVWRATPELVVRLDERFGDPVDAYVNGSQVWLRDDGPNEATIEWRLHPVPGYEPPAGIGTYDLFTTVALAVARGEEPPAPVEALWDGLEAYAAYGAELEPVTLAAAVTESLGMAPDAVGVVDHDRVGDEWESSGRRISIIGALLDQLGR